MDYFKLNAAKFYTALTGFILLVVGTELGADSKWYKYAVAALTAIAVWVIPNKEEPTQGP